MVQDENIMLRNEIQILKTRNTQLIENLRDKSMQLSKTQHKMEAQVSLSYFISQLANQYKTNLCI